jgi:hypothetical protein
VTRRLSLIVLVAMVVAIAAGGFTGPRATTDPGGPTATIGATSHHSEQAAAVARRAPEALRAVHQRLLRSAALAAVAAALLSLAVTSLPGRRRRSPATIAPALVLRRHSITLRAPPVLPLIPA